ncbi:MAG: hypothetical protein HOG93_08005 [Rhodospirillaceae bacterium]|nr:hypothetical protein [Rhodospirillaceae bacterium]
MSNVSTYGTNQRDYLREDFWLIVVTEGNADETEIADTSDRWGQGDQYELQERRLDFVEVVRLARILQIDAVELMQSVELAIDE